MAVCDCDKLTFPVPLDIAPGLKRLPRQIGMFGAFRLAMLAEVREHDALIDWRARDENDFGLMMLEWWAYVSDVISFYTSEHANELYLGTAGVEDNVRRIVQLIGYRPRPATAASAALAAYVGGTDLTTAPAGSRFISDAFDDQPPQDFEIESDVPLDPRLNEFIIAPIPTGAYDPERLLIDPTTRNLAEGAIAVLDVGGSRAAIRIERLEPESALDGRTYLRLTVEDASVLPSGPAALSDVRLWSFAQSLPVADISGSTVKLDGLFPQLRVNGLVVLEENETDLSWYTVDSITYGRRVLVAESSPDPAITTPTTSLTLSSTVSAVPQQSVLHFDRLRGGRMISPARHELDLSDIQPSVALAGPNDQPEIDPGSVLLKGARNQGAQLPSTLQVDAGSGKSTLTPDGSAQPFASTLRTPVKVHGNLLAVTRGKTVTETLGSGQGAIAFQKFTLSKKPLTYVPDPTAPRGRRSSLRVWVDNIEWREVDSLFLAASDERVFTVELDTGGLATITFGGDGYGLPAPLGVKNIVARYRFGAGEPPPPANTIRQIAGPVPGLSRVFNVRPAYGGGAGDSPEDVRHLASASASTFDRAVSAADFAALAREFGALNAVAATEWVPARVREGVVVTAVFEGEPTPEITDALEQYLKARAAEATPVRVIAADPFAQTLELSFVVAGDSDPIRVSQDIKFQLLDEFQGFLAPRNARIGGPLFRSAILAAATKAAGLDQVVSLLLGGITCPLAIPLNAHEYLAPTLVLTEVTA